jgi:hypothetical protein
MVPATVTLEVTPQQALALARVQDLGVLTLALRPYGDDHVDGGDYAPPPPPPAPPEPKKVVEVAAPVVVEKKTLVIQNGSQWIRATYTTQNGETSTTVERSQSESAAMPPAAPREDVAAKAQAQKASSKE